jgi:dienelactone hydrolase
MERADADFRSGGDNCAAWLYRPLGAAEPVPCVVMAHGFSAVRDQRLPAFAECFAAAGYAALVFDYRHFGDSDGEPRQLLDVKRQLDDWRAAVAHARHLTGIDPDRIVVWGTSFAGGHAISIAAEDHRLAAAIAQGPFADGLTNIASYGLRHALSLAVPAIRDGLRGLLRRPPYLLPAVGLPGQRAIICTPDALSGFLGATGPDSLWRNEIAARIGLFVEFYRPVKKAADIRCPILFCIAARDVVTPPPAARKAAALAPRSELKEYDARHFDIYVGETFEQVVTDELDFLKRHVG